MSTSVGNQSRDANISFLTVPGLMTPGQRMTIGARMPPSQVVSFPPLNGVVPPSGKVITSAPLSVVNTTIVLSSWPMSSSFFSTYADVVVHLLHAGFVDAPVLAALLAEHGLVLRRQQRRDVHARRVVPDEERLVGLLRIVAVEVVDDLGRDLLVHRLRAIERQRALVLARLIGRRAVGRRAPDHRARRRQARRRLRIHGAGDLGEAGNRRVLARRGDGLLGRRLVDVGEADPCIASRWYR